MRLLPQILCPSYSAWPKLSIYSKIQGHLESGSNKTGSVHCSAAQMLYYFQEGLQFYGGLFYSKLNALQSQTVKSFAFPNISYFLSNCTQWQSFTEPKSLFPTNFTKLLRTLDWKPLSSHGKVTLHAQTNQNTPIFWHLRQPSRPQSVF